MNIAVVPTAAIAFTVFVAYVMNAAAIPTSAVLCICLYLCISCCATIFLWR